MIMGILLGTLAFRSSYASILDFRYNHVPLPPSSIHTRFSYRPEIENPAALYSGETCHLQSWDWWNPLESETNDERERLWLRRTKEFGAPTPPRKDSLSEQREAQQQLTEDTSEDTRGLSVDSLGTIIHTEQHNVLAVTSQNCRVFHIR